MLVPILSWAVVVAVTVLVMAHRGHSWFTWAVLSGALGPLSWPLAIRALTADRRSVAAATPVADVLIAIAPWAVSAKWIAGSTSGMDPPARAATVVSVLDAEDAVTAAGRKVAEETEALLLRCCKAIAERLDVPVDHRLLFGKSPDAIARFAESGGFRIIVLGPGGSTSHHLVHGHTRTRIERLTSIPIVSMREVVA